MRLISLICAIFLTVTLFAQSIIYVDYQASGSNNGSSWNNAYLELYDALETASSGDSIFISEGTYTPRDTGRNSSFLLTDQLTIVGGFDPHNGISTLDQINSHFFNKVILSGDIGIMGDSSDNSYHVIKDLSPGILTQGSSLVGVEIYYGRADDSMNADNSVGGGVWIRGGLFTLSKSAVRFCYASNKGAAIMIEQDGYLELSETSLSDNAGHSGVGEGALYLESSEMFVFETNFIRNSAFSGGAIRSLNSKIQIISSHFYDNSATVGGAIYVEDNQKGVINQSRFYRNSAVTGGAIYNKSVVELTIGNSIVTINQSSGQSGGIYNAADAIIKVVNCNINFNTASSSNGAGMRCVQGDCQILNSIIYNNFKITPTDTTIDNYGTFSTIRSDIGHSYLQGSGGSAGWVISGSTDLGGNIDEDPFVSWSSFSDTVTQEINCQSPLVNAGNNAYNLTSQDRDGNTRVILGTIDIGAQEFQNDNSNISWSGYGDGINWHDPNNWSGCRLPDANDVITLPFDADTIVVDTGFIARVDLLLIEEGVTLIINEDLINQRHGELIAASIKLQDLTPNKILDSPELKLLKSQSAATDTAFIINRGKLRVTDNGINVEGRYNILNEGLIEVRSGSIGFILNNGGIFINKDTVRIRTDLSSSNCFAVVSRRITGFANDKKKLNSLGSAIVIHNTPSGFIDISGAPIVPIGAMSNRVGMRLSAGMFLNEGKIDIKQQTTGMTMFPELMMAMTPTPPQLVNEGTISIANCFNGFIQNLGEVSNNSLFNIRQCLTVPFVIDAGEWNENGELIIED